MTPDHRGIAEDQSLPGGIGKPHQDKALGSPLFQPAAGILEVLSVIDTGENNGCSVDVNLPAQPLENPERDLGGGIMHVSFSFSRINREYGEGDLREAVINQKIGDRHLIESFSTGIADMERNLHPGEQLDQIRELRVTARVAAAADGDPVEVIGHHLEACKGILPDFPQRLPSPVIFPDTPAAVIAADLVGRAVAAPEGTGLLHVLEITVFTKPPAVDSGPSPDVNGQLRHEC